MKVLHEYLKEVRLEKKLSFREAKKVTGLSSGYISDVERNVLQPKIESLKKFAKGYEIDFDYLLNIAKPITMEDDVYKEVTINLEEILFIELIVKNGYSLRYHTTDDYFSERVTMEDYYNFEEEIENKNFLRCDAGVFINLSKIKALRDLKVYFASDHTGKNTSISQSVYKWTKRNLELIIMKNNNVELPEDEWKYSDLADVVEQIASYKQQTAEANKTSRRSLLRFAKFEKTPL